MTFLRWRLSTVRGETLIAFASCGRFKSTKSGVADNGTNTFGIDAALCAFLGLSCIVIACFCDNQTTLNFLPESSGSFFHREARA
jgi:hypothetical protein